MAWNLKEFHTVVLPLVKARLNTAKTIHLDVSAEAGRQGGTVDVQSPFIIEGEARTHTEADRTAKNAFVFDDVVEQSTPITLSDYVYKGVDLRYDFVTYALKDVKDIVNAAANTVARKINGISASLLQTEIDAADEKTLSADEAVAAKEIMKEILRAKTQMDSVGVDTFQRTVAVSPLVGEILLASDQFSSADRAGTPDALREATIGRVYGFDVVIDNALTGLGFVAYEQYAFALVIRPKAKSVSNGVESEVTIDAEGKMVLNSTASFSIEHNSDRLIVGAFVGAKKLDPARSVAVRFAEAA